MLMRPEWAHACCLEEEHYIFFGQAAAKTNPFPRCPTLSGPCRLPTLRPFCCAADEEEDVPIDEKWASVLADEYMLTPHPEAFKTPLVVESIELEAENPLTLHPPVGAGIGGGDAFPGFVHIPRCRRQLFE